MHRELEQIDLELEKLQIERNAIIEYRDKLKRLGPEFLLAECIHKCMCRYNHTDACSWHGETWEDAKKGLGYAKIEYLIKARNVLSTGIDVELAIKVFNSTLLK